MNPAPSPIPGPDDVRAYALGVCRELLRCRRAVRGLWDDDPKSPHPDVEPWTTLAMQTAMDLEAALARAVLCTRPGVHVSDVRHLHQIVALPRALVVDGTLLVVAPFEGSGLPELGQKKDGVEWAMDLVVIEPADVIALDAPGAIGGGQ